MSNNNEGKTESELATSASIAEALERWEKSVHVERDSDRSVIRWKTEVVPKAFAAEVVGAKESSWELSCAERPDLGEAFHDLLVTKDGASLYLLVGTRGPSLLQAAAALIEFVEREARRRMLDIISANLPVVETRETAELEVARLTDVALQRAHHFHLGVVDGGFEAAILMRAASEATRAALRLALTSW